MTEPLTDETLQSMRAGVMRAIGKSPRHNEILTDFYKALDEIDRLKARCAALEIAGLACGGIANLVATQAVMDTPRIVYARKTCDAMLKLLADPEPTP